MAESDYLLGREPYSVHLRVRNPEFGWFEIDIYTQSRHIYRLVRYLCQRLAISAQLRRAEV
jgi:hypothetical protein